MAVDLRAAKEGQMLAQTLLGRGVHSVALTFSNDQYGIDARAAFASAFVAGGGAMTVQAVLSPISSSFGSQIAQLAVAGGDYLVALEDMGATRSTQFLRAALQEGSFDHFGFGHTMPVISSGAGLPADFLLTGVGASESGRAVFSIDFDKLGTTTTNFAQEGGTGADGSYYGTFIADLINGTVHDDAIIGLAGRDTLIGYDGADYIEGGKGADLIQAGPGGDVIYGGLDADTIQGGGGNDSIYGGAGSDKITGGTGNDLIKGGFGDDVMFGNAGADRFVFRAHDGNDTIRDFHFAEGDRLSLDQQIWGGGLTRAQVVANFATLTDTGAVLTFSATEKVVVDGVASLDQLAHGLLLFG